VMGSAHRNCATTTSTTSCVTDGASSIIVERISVMLCSIFLLSSSPLDDADKTSKQVVKSAAVSWSEPGISLMRRILFHSASDRRMYMCWLLYGWVGSARSGRSLRMMTEKISCSIVSGNKRNGERCIVP
jgi:hypothetical protein